MLQSPSLVVQAHRMTRAAMWAPFVQWRLAAVILLVTVLPVVALVFLAGPLTFALSDILFGPDWDYFEEGFFLVAYLLFFAVLSYPFTIWGAAIWWRSQAGPIQVRVPLTAVWKTGVIYLIPMAAMIVGMIPFFQGLLPGPEEGASVPEENLLLAALTSFFFYWLAFRLATGLVRAALGPGEKLGPAWQQTRDGNRLCLMIALDLTVLTAIIEAVIRAAERYTLAGWEIAVETGQLDAPWLAMAETATTTFQMLVFTWLFFVELALIWMLSQRYQSEIG